MCSSTDNAFLFWGLHLQEEEQLKQGELYPQLHYYNRSTQTPVKQYCICIKVRLKRTNKKASIQPQQNQDKLNMTATTTTLISKNQRVNSICFCRFEEGGCFNQLPPSYCPPHPHPWHLLGGACRHQLPLHHHQCSGQVSASCGSCCQRCLGHQG